MRESFAIGEKIESNQQSSTWFPGIVVAKRGDECLVERLDGGGLSWDRGEYRLRYPHFQGDNSKLYWSCDRDCLRKATYKYPPIRTKFLEGLVV